ncbi:very short patch repair endonuclease [Roseibium marinum]|nr:very short patch repair endonuclease [Roseibium marinum]
MDTRTPEQRRRIMQSVQTKNTGPEMVVRQLLHSHGYRYRLHRKDLPGRPDIVFASKRKAIFVHGCFWHGHNCDKGKLPKSKLEYWTPKIAANKARDAKNVAELEAKGWKVLVIWQCELPDNQTLWLKLKDFMES